MKTCFGLYTALITPFKEGKIDEEALIALLQQQQEAGVDGIVLLGTTGEAPTLTYEEKKHILQLSRKTLPKVKLIAGVGSPSTQISKEYAKMAESEGIDALLVVTPYYNKPNQEGIVCHFEEILKSTHLPLIAYSIMGRTGINIEVSTVQKLAQIPQIIGIKEASKNLMQIMEILAAVKKERPQFSVLAGDDPFTFPMMSLGADGVICTASNLYPQKLSQFIKACQSNFPLAKEMHLQLLPLFQALAVETNPIPIKAAMAHLGYALEDVRLPLTHLSLEKKKALSHFLENFQ